ncbi:MAG: NADH-quinone oxidoreductase subunit L [Gammaproteobacteria bacterium]|nr:NADH-quinone oxidoreductase subunit L [Rhodocyclaceae bacterium]MBU3908772.1 NADH-quinone oxidoreductase subunit L [Gammaproteobacteria bacterium]MBU4004800.1 NADH-quinone oxidoreductase subunit L [Gammaproteobacteria bacterium]MBU4021403.1 NADH-quinone oxidoreductase subunit L [Gammaproteobacteria bacterium]MBU4096420.1 NADH-quinone oxidoreductase subunit L [Gammaproteobacteria bacterium]
MKTLYLIVPLAPLLGAIIAGFFGKLIGRTGAHVVTILGVSISFLVSLVIFRDVSAGNTFNGDLYTWLESGGLSLKIGFLIDPLTVLMMLVVTFVSLMVHIYTIGYMAHDEENWPADSRAGTHSYQRFFAYISLFTFSMLMLVMSNNFVQLFFGWEAVGLVSYLLIGFWSTRPTAIYANLKAFLVNRVGDFGFLLAIGLIAAYAGSLDYATVFAQANELATITESTTGWPLITAICIGLFIGAMGKSAQFPLHVWLPDSMEGPTPISALIHAATMVTAGIFMVSRMSPLFELSDTALSFVIVIGAITTLFMALIAIVQTDIKRVVAYSTLSQLGYMTMALGASAYSVAIFHLMTHAFFKAVLFLGAGSVIIAMHHVQDMRKMGGLRKYLPITYATMLIGAIANAGLPPFAGFFSKDSIIIAVQMSELPGASFAYFCALAGVFVGGLYSFRLVFFTFHGKERFREVAHGDNHGHHHVHEPHESPKVVTVPLILLSIPAIASGWLIGSILYGSWFGEAIFVAPEHGAMAQMKAAFNGVFGMMAHGVVTLPFWLALAGAVTAWFLYVKRPDLPAVIKRKSGVLATILEEKYGFDKFNEWFFAGGARGLGRGLWKVGDQMLIDGVAVNGSARLVSWFSSVVRLIQSGHIYQYAFSMIIGVFVLLTLWLNRA